MKKSNKYTPTAIPIVANSAFKEPTKTIFWSEKRTTTLSNIQMQIIFQKFKKRHKLKVFSFESIKNPVRQSLKALIYTQNSKVQCQFREGKYCSRIFWTWCILVCFTYSNTSTFKVSSLYSPLKSTLVGQLRTVVASNFHLYVFTSKKFLLNSSPLWFLLVIFGVLEQNRTTDALMESQFHLWSSMLI